MSVKIGKVEHSDKKRKMGDNRAERVKPIRGQESLVKERLQGGITTTKGLLVKSYAAVICKTDAVESS